MENTDMIMFNVDEQKRLVDYRAITENSISMDLLCGKFLYQQAQLALAGAYVPNETIYYKPFNVKPSEGKTTNFLESLVNRNLTDKLATIPLRQLTFVYENHPGELEQLSDMESWMDLMRHEPKLQQTVTAYEQYHTEREKDIAARTVTAIQTDKGVLLFNDSGRGLRCVADYLQDMANRYFSPDFKNLESLQMYYFSTSNQNLVQESRQCASIFSADSPHQFIPSKARFLDSRIMEGISPAIKCTMAPERESYRSFVKTFGLEESHKNLNIALLDDICKNGLIDYRYKEHPGFSHKNSFDGILNKLQNSFVHEPTHQFLKNTLHDVARDTAKRILQTQYEVRGYESPKQEKKKKTNNKIKL